MAIGRRVTGAGVVAALLATMMRTATCAIYCVQLKGDPAVLRLPENYKLTTGANQRVAAVSAASAAVEAEHADFAKSAAKIKYETQYTYKQVYNGLSVTLAGTDAEQASAVTALKALPQVKAVTKVVFYKKLNPNHRKYMDGTTAANARRSLLQTPVPPQAGILYNGNATRAYDVNTKLGITGLGVKVGVIDTGIDYLHPDLGGGFGPGYRVITGYDYVGDAGTSTDGVTLSLFPDNDPRDICDGHGTHVSGIIGANGNVVGSAPDVSFGAYRVFSCDGSTGANTILIAAAEQAYEDGMDIINLSLGSGPTWPTSGPDAVINEVLANLVYAGLVVSVSAGNSGGISGYAAGGLGLFAVSSPSNPPGVISVASSEDTTVQVHDMIVNPGDLTINYVRAQEQQNVFPANTPFELVPTFTYDYDSSGVPTSLPPDDACTPAQVPSTVAGKVAFARRGTCALQTKFDNAVAAGATGIVIYNSVSVGLDRIISSVVNFDVGAAFISAGDGLTLLELLHKGAVTVSFPDEIAFRVKSGSAGALSDFSSYGPAVDLSFKPDISAPGSLILSTYPLPLGGYYEDQGTSMSCPALVGCAALLLQARPGFSAANVRYQVQNTATPLVDISDTGLTTKPAPVHNQGAGQVDIYAALTYGLDQRITPSAVSLGYGNGKTVSVRVDNYGTSATKYTLSHEGALAELYSTDVPSQTKVVADATASFSVPSFTVPAKSTVNFEFTITAPASLPANSLYGGWVVLTSSAGVSRVPYIGWKGDYSKLDVVDYIGLADDYEDLPETGSGLVGNYRDQVFNFTTTVPYFQLNLFLPSQNFTAVLTYLDVPNFSILVAEQPYPLSIALGDYTFAVSNQALQSEFISFGNGYKYALPTDDTSDFGCTIPNGRYQLTFTVVNTGGLVSTYAGTQTYFRVINALPTPTPYCQFTPVTKPTKVPAATTGVTAKPASSSSSSGKKTAPKKGTTTTKGTSKPHAKPHARPHARPHAKPHAPPHRKPHAPPHRKPIAKSHSSKAKG